MPDGNIKVLVEGVERARAVEVNDSDGFFVATVRTGKTQLELTPQVEQLMQRVHSLFEQYVKLQQSLNYETMAASARVRTNLRSLPTPSLRTSSFPSRRSSNCSRSSTRNSGWHVSVTFSTSRLKNLTWTALSSHALSGRWRRRRERVLPQREDQGHPEGARPR